MACQAVFNTAWAVWVVKSLSTGPEGPGAVSCWQHTHKKYRTSTEASLVEAGCIISQYSGTKPGLGVCLTCVRPLAALQMLLTACLLAMKSHIIAALLMQGCHEQGPDGVCVAGVACGL